MDFSSLAIEIWMLNFKTEPWWLNFKDFQWRNVVVISWNFQWKNAWFGSCLMPEFGQ